MEITWRLTGDRNVAAAMRGEARRVMFHLDQYSKDVSVNALNRIYPDGSQITIYKFFDNRIVLINGVSIPVVAGQPLLDRYIMVYFGPQNIKFYLFSTSYVYETQDTPAINILSAYASQPDLLILNDSIDGSEPVNHVVN